MRELANARGFYPVYAVIPDSSAGGPSHFAPRQTSKGGGKGKGFAKGRSKGRGKGKSKGGRAPFRPLPRTMPTTPSATTSAPPTTTASPKPRSTTSGSTQQHGPRFKRCRSDLRAPKPASAANEESMVAMGAAEYDDEVLISEDPGQIGKGVGDSGATQLVMGEQTVVES